MTHQRHLNASIWLRFFLFVYALSARIMIMPVPLLVPFDPRGRGCGVVARDSRKTGVVAPGDSCFIPHEARGEARVDGHGDWSPTSPSVPLSTHPDLLFAIEIIFPSISGHSSSSRDLDAFAKIILTNRLSSATSPLKFNTDCDHVWSFEDQIFSCVDSEKYPLPFHHPRVSIDTRFFFFVWNVSLPPRRNQPRSKSATRAKGKYAAWSTETRFINYCTDSIDKKKKGKEEKRVWRAINPGHQFADGRGVENERERSVYLWNRGSGSMRPPLASILTNKFREQKTALGHAAVAESSFGPSAFQPRRRCQGFGPASNHFYRFLLSSSRKKKRGGARAGHDTEQRLPKAHVTSVFGTRPSR